MRKNSKVGGGGGTSRKGSSTIIVFFTLPCVDVHDVCVEALMLYANVEARGQLWRLFSPSASLWGLRIELGPWDLQGEHKPHLPPGSIPRPTVIFDTAFPYTKERRSRTWAVCFPLAHRTRFNIRATVHWELNKDQQHGTPRLLNLWFLNWPGGNH